MNTNNTPLHTQLAAALLALLPLGALAGSLDSPGAPTAAGAQMYTVEDLYNRLNSGTAGSKASSFTEPSAGPSAGTMHTLNDIMGKAPSVDDSSGASAAEVGSGKTFWGLTSSGWGLQTGTATIKTVYPAPVARTGQGASYKDGAGVTIYQDDGDWRAGVRRTGARFVDNGDGTVTDQLTGLVWLANANCAGAITDWSTALADVAELNSAGTMNGNGCGDTSNGGSHQSDWRLPNVNELRSLLDYGYSTLLLRGDAPFTNQAGDVYWTATTITSAPTYAWSVSFWDAWIDVATSVLKTSTSGIAWAVRGTSAGAAPVAKTGQTTCYDAGGNSVSCTGTGQDGELQAGVAWPSPRFTANGDGTVTDNLTGLIWLQNANCFGAQLLLLAVTRDTGSGLVPGLVPGLKDGDCGLSDGSAAGDWRLPNVNELASLLDYERAGPALPSGHPFSNVQSATTYWSSTFHEFISYYHVSVGTGAQNFDTYTANKALWAVRGGE